MQVGRIRTLGQGQPVSFNGGCKERSFEDKNERRTQGDNEHPIANRIRHAFSKSNDFSSTDSTIEVRNMSAWYHTRNILGPRRQSACIVKREKGTKKFLASIFEISEARKVKKHALGIYSTQVKAHRACEKACRIRDEKFLFVTTEEGKCEQASLDTHFHVSITSKIFHGLTLYQRTDKVYQVLLEEYFDPDSNIRMEHPKGFSYVGNNVRNLAPFKHLGSKSFHISLDLRSPDEISIADDELCTDAEIKSLREMSRDPLNASTNMSAFGHFFYGLSSESKSLVLAEFAKNTKLANGEREILQHGYYNDLVVTKCQTPTPWTVCRNEENREKNIKRQITSSRAVFKEQQRRSNHIEDEDSISAKYQSLVFAQTDSAIRMQRLFRKHYFSRFKREWHRLQRAILKIQSQERRRQAKEFVEMKRTIFGAASVKIQSIWRRWKGSSEAEQKRKQITTFVLTVQPIIRGWIGRSYARWVMNNWCNAVQIQRLVRGYIGRCRLHHLRVKGFQIFLEDCAIKIQRVFRGHAGRNDAKSRRELRFHNNVVVPCVVLIQSFARCYIARILLKNKRILRDNVKNIQKYVRGRITRSWINIIRHRDLEERSAIKIQARVRGWIDHNLYTMQMSKQRFYTRCIPSSILIQAQLRGYYARKQSQIRKTRCYSARKIQSIYRKYVAKIKSEKRWLVFCQEIRALSAIMIQRHYRGHIQRRVYYRDLCRERARRLVACRIIKAAWSRFTNFRSFKIHQHQHRIEERQRRLVQLKLERKEVLEDLEEIENDLTEEGVRLVWSSSRIKEIYNFQEKIQQRLSQIKAESDKEEKNVSEKQCWQTIFSEEKEQLLNQESLSKQELRMCRAQILSSKQKQLRLQLEMDNVLTDLDEICRLEFEENEEGRRMDIHSGLSKQKNEMDRKVRYEINRWKIKESTNCPKLNDSMSGGGSRRALQSKNEYHSMTNENTEDKISAICLSKPDEICNNVVAKKIESDFAKGPLKILRQHFSEEVEDQYLGLPERNSNGYI